MRETKRGYMNFSTKSRYGLRALAYIAKSKKPMSLHVIAGEQDMSLSYLEQLAAKLKKANILESKRGKYGGYVLARPADKIYIGEVLRVLEDDILPVECLGSEQQCIKETSCISNKVFKKIYDSIREVVDKTTLQDVL